MKKLFFITWTNIKRKGGLNTAFLFIMVLAVLLMYIGLAVKVNFGNAFHEKCREMNSAQIISAFPGIDDQKSFSKYISSFKGITQVEKRDVMYTYMSYKYAKSEMSGNIVILNLNKNTKLGKITYTEKVKKINHDNTIYLPLIFHTGGGYELGDKFKITISNKTFTYYIGGFFEEMMLGSTNGGLTAFLLDKSQFNKLNGDTSNLIMGKLFLAKLKDSKKDQEYVSKINNYINSNIKNSSNITVISESTMELSRCNTANIISAIIFAFSIIILAVGLIIIRYKIYDYVQDNLVNIGTLKALGYTSNVLIASVIFQFLFVISISIIVGIAMAMVVMPSIANVLSMQSGMTWSQGFDLRITLIIVGLIFATVIIISLISLYKICKIYPVKALRKDTFSHKSKKNYFPLDKFKLNYNILMSIKYCLYNMKQNIAIVLVFFSVSFVSMFAIILGFNTVINNTRFVKVMFGVFGDVRVVQNVDNRYIENFNEKLVKLKGAEKVVYFGYERAYLGGQSFFTYVSNDFSKLDSKMCYKGREPKSANEMAISGMASEKFHKNIGDIVKVSYGNSKCNYKITGLTQSAYSNGYECELTIDGYKRLKENYKGYQIIVYLKSNLSAGSYINSVFRLYKGNVKSCNDYMKNVNSFVNVYVNLLRYIIIIIFMISLLIIILVMYLVVKSVILHMQSQFGIQKAIGYTGGQLIFQLSQSFMPVTILGVVFGSILGYCSSSSLISGLLHNVGIMELNLIVNPVMILMNFITLCLFNYLIIYIVSLRINKISAVALIRGD